MRKKIVAGNWKMNLNTSEAKSLVEAINSEKWPSDVQLMCFPSALYIQELSKAASATVKIGTQNFYFEQSGAYTGENSIDQLKSVGAEIALIGHSERRDIFGESNAILKSKVNAAVENNFDFIFCCGEHLNIRKSKKEKDFVRKQLEESLFHLSKEQIKNVVIAYEPVWAIGTGETATADQAEDMHAAIRSWIVDKYDQQTADGISILYGGSCKPSNAQEIFSKENVDGGLIGGASLKAVDFVQIANSY